MGPELLDVGLVGRIPIIGSVQLQIFNVDLVEATRYEQLNFVWKDHVKYLWVYNFLHSVHESFGLHAILLVEDVVCVEHYILHLVVVCHWNL